MMKRTQFLLSILLVLLIVVSCEPMISPQSFPTNPPGHVNTVIAQTASAAAALTESAQPTKTDTPPPTATFTETPTNTVTPTATFFFALPTLTPTKTPAPTSTLPVVGPGGGSGGAATTTPLPIKDWPAWNTGTIANMPTGSGEGIGTTKMFDVLVNVKVKVVRPNGVKLRSIPSLVVGEGKVPVNTILYLTGLWNKNRDWNWTHVKVLAPDGKLWWVGDREGESSDPEIALEIVP